MNGGEAHFAIHINTEHIENGEHYVDSWQTERNQSSVRKLRRQCTLWLWLRMEAYKSEFLLFFVWFRRGRAILYTSGTGTIKFEERFVIFAILFDENRFSLFAHGASWNVMKVQTYCLLEWKLDEKIQHRQTETAYRKPTAEERKSVIKSFHGEMSTWNFVSVSRMHDYERLYPRTKRWLWRWRWAGRRHADVKNKKNIYWKSHLFCILWMLNDDSIEINFRNMAHTRTWRISIVFEYEPWCVCLLSIEQ